MTVRTGATFSMKDLAMRAIAKLLPRARSGPDTRRILEMQAMTDATRAFVQAYEERLAIDRKIACRLDEDRQIQRKDPPPWNGSSTAP